jgi:hypothetical protein
MSGAIGLECLDLGPEGVDVGAICVLLRLARRASLLAAHHHRHHQHPHSFRRAT